MAARISATAAGRPGWAAGSESRPAAEHAPAPIRRSRATFCFLSFRLARPRRVARSSSSSTCDANSSAVASASAAAASLSAREPSISATSASSASMRSACVEAW